MNVKSFRNYLNFNNIVLFIVGALLLLWGAWSLYRFRQYIFGGGLVCIGIGNLLFAFTNGFADTTPTGRFLFKVGAFAYLSGFGLVGYSMRYILL